METSTLRSFFPPDQQWPLQVGMPDCADAGLLAALVADGHQVYATLEDSQALARCRRAAGPGALMDLASTAALPWPAHCLDLCVIPPSWHGSLGELLRVLKPGGAFLAPTPSLPLRTCLALSGASWLDQFDYPGGALLAFTQAQSDCRQVAAAALLCSDRQA